MRSAILGTAAVLLAGVAHATTVFVPWDKAVNGKRENVAAIDLSAGKVLWDATAAAPVNFAEKVSGGVLVGCDAGKVLMLDPADGKVLWTVDLGKTSDITTFRGEVEEGYFLSRRTEAFWVISRTGKLALFCRTSCYPVAKADAADASH